MRHCFSLALGLAALALCVTLSEQHMQSVNAAPGGRAPNLLAATFNHREGTAQTNKPKKTGQAHKTNAAGGSAAPVIREIDLEALKKLLQRETGKDARPLLVNFWATWCEPCRDEFPDLVRINSDYKQRNLDVITVSLDLPEEIKTTVPEFLREVRAGELPAYLLNVIEPETVINTIDPEWGGGLPATFLYDASGQMVFKHTGRFNAEELRAAIDKVTTGK